MTMTQLTIMVLTKIYGIMKKVNRIFLPLAMVIPFVACNKEEVINPSNDGTLHIDVVAAVEDLANAADTKTYINGTDILWGTNEQMEIALIDPTDATKGTFKSSEATSEFDGKAQATFSFNVTMETEPASFIYGGVYPYNNGIDNTNPSAYKVSLPEIQNATAESYDPAAYILVAKAESFDAAQTTWKASFKRAAALNRLTMINLDDDIVAVEISLPSNAVIAGRRYVDLSTGEMGEIYYNKTNSIRINYATALSAASDKDVWFTSWGAEVKAGENITIKAYSETTSYTRTITAREEGISFKEGYYNILTVDMKDAVVAEMSEFEEGAYLIGTYYNGIWNIMTNVAGRNFFQSLATEVSTPQGEVSCSDFYATESITNYVWDINKTEEGYTISNASGYLMISGSDMKYSDSPAFVTITEREDGTYAVTNPGGANTIRFNTNNGQARFKPYNNSFPYVVLIPWIDDPDYKYCSVPASLSVESAAGTKTFNVDANVAWSIESSNAEFTVSPASGSGAGTVTLAYPENIATEEVVVTLTVKNETGDKTITVTQAAVPSSYKKVSAVTSGKFYLILVENEGKYYMAKPVASSNPYGYLSVDEVSVEGEAVYANGDNAFVITETDGNYTICQPDGRFLYMSGTYNNFNVSDAPSSGNYWTIEPQADGTVKITNVANSKYIQYSSQYNSFGSYGDTQGIMPSLYERVE